MGTYSLICEGRCNPQIKQLDAAIVVEERRSRGADRDGHVPLSAPPLIRRLRSLQYTSHVMVHEYEAECTICGTHRQYGGNRRG